MKNNSHYALSISDLMMGLLFIFILILMKFMMEYQDKKQDLSKPILERGRLLEKLKEKMEQKNIQVEIDKKNGVLKLTDVQYFDKGEYKLSEKGKNHFRKIKKIFNALICYSDLDSPKTKNRWPKNKAKKTTLKKWQAYCNKEPHFKKQALIDSILIEGHADATPIGLDSPLIKKGIKTNLDLAMKRAQTVFVFLLDYKEAKVYDPDIGKGPTPESGNHFWALVNKQEKPLFGVTSYGNLRKNASISKSNRRIDIRFIMSEPEELSKHFKNKEVQY